MAAQAPPQAPQLLVGHVSTASHALSLSGSRYGGVMARRLNMYRVSRFRDDAKTMRVRLVKKLADMIDDIDLSRARIGDILTLRFEQALLLVAEGWAVPHASRT